MKNKILNRWSFIAVLFFITCMTTAQTTLTLQPGSSAGKDAMVSSYTNEVNVNYGAHTEIPAEAWTGNGTPFLIRSFIKFNFASIPANSTILSADLSLYAVDAGSGIGQHSTLSGSNNGWIQRVTSSWDESSVTWNSQPASTVLNRVAIPASTSPSQDYIINVSPLVRDILSGPSGNFGFELILDVEEHYRRLNFYSGDCAIASKRPKLVITYCSAPPAAITPSGPTTVCSGSSVLLNANTGTGFTYQWKFNGNNIAGATSISYSATASGSYNVIVTNSSGCPGTSAAVIVSIGNFVILALRPDGSGEDASVNSHPLNANTNFGALAELPASAWTAGGTPVTWRSYTRFDLSSLPPASSIISASLSLYAIDAGAGAGQHSTLSGANNGWIERVTSLWDESTIIWNNQPSSTIQNHVALHSSTSPSEDYPDIDVTALIQDIISSPNNNFGFMLRMDNENNYRRLNFCSSDYADSSRRPKLILTYTFADTAIITPAGPLTFCNGSSVLLNANTGSGFTYQWKKSGSAISGATNASYFATSSGNYTVTVTSPAGCSALSSSVTVTVNPLPSATITPGSSTTFCSGGNVLLNAVVAANRLYQWKKNGVDISGATSAVYSVTSGGIYKVTVTNTLTGCVKTTANGIAVTVNSLPAATITPQGPTTFCAGGSVVLAANTGAGLTYKWKKGSNFIPGATSSNYTATTAGTYRVEVTNSNGCSKLSAGITVSVPCKEGEGGSENLFIVNVYPNPAHEKLTVSIHMKENTVLHIKLINFSGRTVLSENYEGNAGMNNYQLDLSHYSKGVYMLAVNSGNEKKNVKVIIE